MKYQLTSNDPRYLNTTREEMITDWWAYRFTEDPKAADEIEDEDFDLAAEMAKIERGETSPDDWEDL